MELKKWLTMRTGLGIALVLVFWVAVLVWPDDWKLDGNRWRIVPFVAALLFFGATWEAMRDNGKFRALKAVGPVFLLIGAIMLVVTVGVSDFGLDDANRFPIAVGGTALAGLLLGLVRYETIRAAASVVAIVLIIGVLTFPGGQEIVGEDHVGTVVGWMAALIGANAVAEAAVQTRKEPGEVPKGDLAGDGSATEEAS